MSRSAVLCVGQATLDHVFEVQRFGPIGHKTEARSHHTVGGGIAANAAVAVSRLGGVAIFVGCVGDDQNGVAVLDALVDDGVDTRHVVRVGHVPTPVSAVVVGDDGGRSIVNHTDPALFDRSAPSGIDATLDAVLVDGRWSAGTLMGLELARVRGIPSVVDVDRFPADDRLRNRMLDAASHLVFSADALAELTGTPQPSAGLLAAGELTSAFVAVTCGENGVHWLDRPTVRTIAPLTIDVVDTTGAGDVFHGAFALALAEGKPEVDALRFASIAAAITCSRPGARAGIPRRREVDGIFVPSRSR